MRLLTVNAGSSSVKIRLLGPGDELLTTLDLTADRGRSAPGALATALAGLGPVDAVAHRIVHGGEQFLGPVRVDEQVLGQLRQLIPLAPLHQTSALAALCDTMAVLPDIPAVACFDTAFHSGMPAAASTYAIPARWRTELGVRRYGFHGLAHQWAARRTVELLGPVRRIVVAHLGSGASLCAVLDGRSVDTTMGFTPTAGLVMGTRCGDLDPAVPGWLVEQAGLELAEVTEALDHACGLRGLAGSADMRVVLAAQDAGDPGAVLAVQVWLHRLRGGIAAMAAALGGIDVLVFSGGIGERAPELRRRTVEGLGFLGVCLDVDANAAVGRRVDGAAGLDVDVSAEGPGARVLVVHAREELVMAGQTRAVLAQVRAGEGGRQG
jgi:acetate kinase